MTLDDYRDAHPRVSGTNHDYYDLETYKDWKRQELDEIESECYSTVVPYYGGLIARLVDILRQDPRR